jgi:hypothetical protein
MAIANQERVGKSLELLREGLQPFAEREMNTLLQSLYLMTFIPHAEPVEA